METAGLEWLENIRNLGREGLDFEILYEQMIALSAAIRGGSLDRCCCWFIDHFDEMRKLFPSRDKHYKPWRREVIFLATHGVYPEFSDVRLKPIRPQMIKILDSGELDVGGRQMFREKGQIEIMFRHGFAYESRLEKRGNFRWFDEKEFNEEFRIMNSCSSLSPEELEKRYQEQKGFLLQANKEWRAEDAAVIINPFEE
jgi:hypothetical protein